MTERAEDMQFEALRAFLFLQSLRPSWGGALAISCGLSQTGAAFTVAANLAGAGSLAIEANPNLARTALRSGASDFVVNSVDEALRVLKNEIRKHQPVSVALAMEESAALDQLASRGVAPQVFAVFGSPATGGLAQDRIAAAEAFQCTGATIAKFDGGLASAGTLDAIPRLDDWLEAHSFGLAAFVFGTSDEVRVFDRNLLEVIPTTDPRHRWCVGAPRLFHRERPYRRVVALTSKERAVLKV